jgi:hypothetical protein
MEVQVKRISSWLGVGGIAVGLSASGCGIEGLFKNIGGNDNEPDVAIVSGSLANGATAVQLILPDDSQLDPVDSTVGGGRYELSFEIPGEITNGLLSADEGAKQLKAWLPVLRRNQSIEGVDLDAASTAAVVVVGGAMSAQDKTRQTIEASVARQALEDFDEGAQTAGSPEATLVQMVQEIIDLADASDTTSTPLRAPVLTSSTTVQSALDATWWAANSASAPFTQEAFDEAVLDSASGLNVVGCIDEENIRVVFEVDLREPRLDGACREINGFGGKGFVSPDPGDRMFFVGGVQEDSPIQNQELNNEMGAWDPNLVEMYDNGTNGDEVAGDNIWTVTFVAPRGAYLSYKYTWGTPAEGWNDTEEWPGNERWLEVIDMNGDNFVRRRDTFADEASNKNVRNECCGLPFVTLTWDPPMDPDGDGYANTREEPFRLPEFQSGNFCTGDEYVTPTGIGPATVECTEL